MKKILILFWASILTLSLFAAEEMDLYMALLNQDWLKAKSLLDNNSFLLDKQGEEEFKASLGGHLVESVGKTPLIFSVEYGLDLMIVRLLEYGADMERVDSRGWTPLMVSSYKGNYDAARMLLESGARVNVFDQDGLSPLALAVGACRFDVADLLLDWQANLYGPIPGAFPLVEDIYQEKIEIRDTLRILDRGAPGYPLFKGVEEDNYSLVRTILLQGMFPDSTDSQGVTPLMKAASLKTPYMTELLVEQGADVNHREIKGLSPLSVALFYGRQENVKILIEGEAQKNSGDWLQDSPLYYAIIGGNGYLVRYLVENNATVTRRDNKGEEQP
jgi:ankyrin repeat protein